MDYQEEYIKKNPTLHVEDTDKKFAEISKVVNQKLTFKSMIDIGCGAGVLTLKVKHSLNIKETLGVDLSSHMIESAQEFDQQKEVRWLKEDYRNLDYSKIYDLSIAMDIVEHVENDEEILEILSKISKYSVIKVPLEYSLMNRFLKRLGIHDTFAETRNQFGHIHYYNFFKIRDLVEKYFEIENYSCISMPKRRTKKWEYLRRLWLPIGIISKKYMTYFGGGFAVFFLKSKNETSD